MNQENLNKGIVIRSTGSWYDVQTDDGNITKCKFKGKYKIAGIKSTNPIAVGDQVYFSVLSEEQIGLIQKLEPRNNYMIRKSTKLSKQTHIIASNIDYALLVITLNQPRTSTGFIDRFLVTAEAYHIQTVLIFNKADLFSEKSQKKVNDLKNLYENLGYRCLQTSAQTGKGLDLLKELMKDKTSLFSGHSGVGKSALINAVEPNLKLKTGQISNYHQKGKHTTTFAEMHPLHFGGYIIDTPGIKEFGLVDMQKETLSGYFPEMNKRLQLCKFNNCLHLNEPHCAVKKAVSNGEIAQSRYNNYLAILEDKDLNKKSYM
mgnify:CR=1 FL=1